ncbi:MAG: T9SS type A sorting domain-containing protein, partial [Bacteroidota bacterium]
VPEESQQVLQNLFPQLVQGDQPVLRFWQRYDTQAGVDAGLVEISTDGGETWADLGPDFFKNGYNGPVDYNTFVVPNLEGFSGTTSGWIDTYADLSAFTGEEIIFRYRYGTDESIAQLGWFVDDVEIMDLFNYNSEACVTADQGDEACAIAENRGTLVESQMLSSLTELEGASLGLAVFPNPAEDLINIQIDLEARSETTIQIIDLQGRIVETRTDMVEPNRTVSIPVADWPTGAYFIQVTTEEGTATQKVFLR